MSREDILKKNGFNSTNNSSSSSSQNVTRDEILKMNGFGSERKNTSKVTNNEVGKTYKNISERNFNNPLYNIKAINTIAPTDKKFAQSLPKIVNNSKAKDAGVGELITQPTENIQKNQNKGGFYNNIVEPTNNLISNAVIGGATAIAKPVLKLGGYVNNILRRAQGKEMYSSDEIQSYVDTMANMTQSLVDRKNTLSEVGKTAGNALAYIGSGAALGGGALGYAAASGANAFGNTNDIGDIAVETGIGAVYGAISSATNKAIVKGIEKIFPVTNPLVGETINVGASALKNAVAGAGGTYTATATTGESRNIYNALRGREVTKEEWIRPMWSGETAISTLVGAGLGAYSGTKADISVRAKYEQDVNVLVNKLNLYAKSFNTSIQNGDKQAALDIARVSRDELVKFSMNKYGNRTVEKSVIDNVANKWKNYLEQTTAYYDYKGTSPNVNGQTKVLMSGNNSNQIANNITNNATKVLNPVESGINSTLNVEQISQNNVQNVSNSQNTIQNDTERFSQEVEEWKNNNWNNKKHLTVLQNTPQLYLDMGLNDLPITVTANKLDRIFNAEGNQKSTYHNLQDLVKELPRVISNPLNIVESSTRDGGIVVVTDLSDSNNDIVVVSLAPDGQGRLEVDDVITTKSANVMTSAYGRRNYDYNVDNQGNYYDGWMEENLKNNRIIYDIDEGIIKKRINGQWLELPNDTDSSNTSVKRLQLPSDTGISDVSSTTNTPINNIIRPGQNYVNNSQENFAFPTNEQLQAMDSLKTKKDVKAFNVGKNKKFMLVSNLNSYKKNIFNNNAKAINDFIKAKNIAMEEFDEKIVKKQMEYNKIKNKTTQKAQEIQGQIVNLKNTKANVEQNFIRRIDNLERRNATINKLKNQVTDDRLPTRKEVQNRIIDEKDIDSINLDNIKNLSRFIMNNTTPQRVNEKIFGKDTANKINDRFFKPIKHNEAERIRFLNKEREEISEWNIKPKSKESAAVQKYGEGEYVDPQTGNISQYTLQDLQNEFPNDWKKIKEVSEKARIKYDNYIDTVNKKLNEMGYDSIPKLKNYFRHFEETTSIFDRFGIPSKIDNLPTDLNGLTADLRPGKNFFANALKRTGRKTTYDAIGGIDGYIEGLSKLIYHTEDIQNLRTLDEYIRGKYGESANLDNLPDEEFKERIKQIQEGHLSEYSAWLTEYTNNLAGKKTRLDRGAEEAFGRRIYKTLNLLKKQVGSNLTGFNLNSALSNFISAGQGFSSTSKIATFQGLIDTMKNIFKKDDFIDKSDFLTTRFGSDKLSKTILEKASNAGQIFMSGTDYLAANLITRSKYHEYLNKGYPENEAIQLAGEYADRLMAGRGLGDMPNFFNSKTLGIITQFQLENVNQFDSMFYDNFTSDRASEQIKYDAKTWNEKIKSKFASANPKFYNGIMSTFVLAQLFGTAYVFNKLVNAIGGNGGAFDPIGTVEEFINDYKKDGLKVASQNLAKNIIDDIPYLNLATGGGRIALKDSLPDVYGLVTGESDLSNEGWKALNVALPTGGGQVRKTIQGALSLKNNGEYGKRDGEEYAKWLLDLDNKTLSEKISTSVRALAFGKYGTKEAKQYINSGYKGFSTKQTEALKKLKDMGLTYKEFYEITEKIREEQEHLPRYSNSNKALPGARNNTIKNALSDTDLTIQQKNYIYNMFKQ